METHEYWCAMQVCFIGHRFIEQNEKLISLLKETVLLLIKKGATNFLFGSKSQFDDLAWEVVTLLKKDYPFIKRIYVRSAFQHIDKSYAKYLFEHYEETYFPPKLENAGKYSYVERNYEMIDNSDYCIFYYNKNHITKNGQQQQRKSGTKTAYEDAVKKKKQIINLYNI